MLDISKKIKSSIRKLIQDLIESSPNIEEKIHSISPLSFSLKIDRLEKIYIQINKNDINVDFDSIKRTDFSVDINVLEAISFISNQSINRKHINGDEEKAFVFINMIKSSHIDFPILFERNFGHLSGVFSYLIDTKLNKKSNVTIKEDHISKQLRNLNIRLDRLEAIVKEN